MLTIHKEDTYELMGVFKELAEMAGLLDTKGHPVQDPWVGKRELCSTYYAVRGSAKDLHFFQHSGTSQIPQNNGSLRHTLPQGTELTGWPLVLPMVWKRGAKQGDHCKPPVHWALLPLAGVKKVSILLHYHIGQDAMPHPGMSVYTLPQRQLG